MCCMLLFCRHPTYYLCCYCRYFVCVRIRNHYYYDDEEEERRTTMMKKKRKQQQQKRTEKRFAFQLDQDYDAAALGISGRHKFTLS